MKAKFKDSLRVKNLDGPWWKLIDRIRYNSAVLDRQIVVPNGFVTDFASVPRYPVTYWMWGNRACRAAVVHDYLYRKPSKQSRYEADCVFYRTMKIEGYSFSTRYPMYTGVRAFGWLNYGTHNGELDPR